MLDLAYDPAIPAAQLREMERAARALGLALATIERLGQDAGLCQAFVVAARAQDHRRLRFLGRLAAEEATSPPRPVARLRALPPA